MNRPSSASTTPLRVLIISDDRPGHYNQSEGVVTALRKRFDVDLTRYVLQRRGLLPRRMQAHLVASKFLPFWLNDLLTGRQARRALGAMAICPDLVVSAGGRTLATNLLISQHCQAANIFSGSIRGLSPDRFSAILHADPKHLGTERFIIGLKPSPIEPTQTRPKRGKPKRLVLLIGGPTGAFPFHVKDIAALTNILDQTPLHWTILSSRRTPKAWLLQLEKVAATHPGHVTMAKFGSANSPSVADALAAADAVVVTADSTSMLSEGVASGLPVVSLTTGGGHPSTDRAYVSMMRENNWIRELSLTDLSNERLVTELGLCERYATNHLDTLADRLIETIPLLHNRLAAAPKK